jgi:hypothetical protein
MIFKKNSLIIVKIMQRLHLLACGLLCFMLPGCEGNHLDFYRTKEPKMDFRHFFEGDIEGSGAFFDFRGRQIRSFYIKINCSWADDILTMKEWFDFDDGEKLERQWEITFKNGRVVQGLASDVIGSATGEQVGSAINLHYILQIPYRDHKINISMDDWMYALSKDSVLNRTAMRKFGFKVGEMVLILKKL